MTLPEQVAGYVAEHHLLAGVEQVVVGFSGGPDSTALLLLMQTLAPRLLAVHLHHGLRPGAEADAVWCRAFCAAREIPYQEARLNVPAEQRDGESTEMAARRLRLAYWHRAVTDQPGSVVALGHHLDDAVETFFQRLLRGANASGLTGLRPRRELGELTLIRPLLCLERPRIEAWLASLGIEPRRDPTNRDETLQRNAIRHRLLPVLRDMDGFAGVAASLDFLEQDARFLETLTLPEGALDMAALRQLPKALLPRVLRAWHEQQTGEDRPLRRSSLEALHEALNRDSDEAVKLDWEDDCFLVLERGQLYLLSREASPLVRPCHWRWHEQPVLELAEIGVRLQARQLPALPDAAWANPACCYWPLAEFPRELVVRARQPGDRFVSYGTNRPVRVKKLVGDAKVSLARKNQLIVVSDAADRRILWLAPLRRAAAAPVTNPESPVVELSYSADDLPLT